MQQRIGPRSYWLVLGAVAIAALVASCSQREPERAAGPLRVVVSVPPLVGIVQALVPDAEIRALIKPGTSPHGHEGTPADLAAVGRADLVVLVGLGLEGGLPAGALKRARVFRMADALGIEGVDDHHGHDHGHEHSHAIDPHLWLDPLLVERMIPEITEELRARLAQVAGSDRTLESLEANAAALTARVRAVHGAYEEGLDRFAGASLITHHNAWSRITDRYGLEVAGVIQIADGVEPSAAHVAKLLAVVSGRDVRLIVTEPQLNKEIAERIAGETDIPVVTLDPLGTGDWESMMLGNLDSLIRGLSPEPPPGGAP